jgi:hypothetical protein
VAVLERVCKLCQQPFTLEYCHGRPREYCWLCVPKGFKLVRVPGQTRTKLRRDPPLWKRSELDIPAAAGRGEIGSGRNRLSGTQSKQEKELFLGERSG